MEKKPVVEAAEEKTILEDDVKVREIYPGTSFEVDIPSSVLVALNVHPGGGSVRFVEENGRVYLEEVKSEEKKTASKEDYYTEYEKRIKEDFEPGSVSIERIDHEWNMKVPENIHYALGVNNGDHIRFEAVDRETFKISKIR